MENRKNNHRVADAGFELIPQESPDAVKNDLQVMVVRLKGFDNVAGALMIPKPIEHVLFLNEKMLFHFDSKQEFTNWFESREFVADTEIRGNKILKLVVDKTDKFTALEESVFDLSSLL